MFDSFDQDFSMFIYMSYVNNPVKQGWIYPTEYLKG